MKRIVPLAEGHGEVQALPALLRRIAERLRPDALPKIQPVIRVKRDRFVNNLDEFHRTVTLAARRAGNDGAVLVLLDADEDCPALLGPELLKRFREQAPHALCSVVLAKREFEAWFLAAADSISGRRGLAAELSAPADPEGVGGAKSWLTQHMPGSRAYREVRDQPALSSLFDLDLARERSPSFDKLRRDLAWLLGRDSPIPEE